PALLGAVAQRGSDLRDRGPCEAHVLMPRFGAGATAVFVLLTCASLGADVADYLGRPVASISVEVEGRTETDPKVLDLIQTQPGSPLSMMQVRESMTHLYSLGRFEDVRVHASIGSTGVALAYELVPLHLVSRVEFSGIAGHPGIDETRLRQAIVERYGVSP